MTKVRSVGAETANIPMKDSYTLLILRGEAARGWEKD